ncbi:MAG: UDP-N-acetylmuramoyl-L-alanine--D-glutamate ligase [Candidatus Kerfeldbacteria bacterium]|nr:UDP-N-acetylmuramoyl-L-alanine--D-glutamate ligase [Candidatus Kerfeldbacteria bacterium]
MSVADLIGRRVLVLGLGLHGGGAAVARWLSRHQAAVTVSDLKSRSELGLVLRRLRGLPIRYVLGAHPLSLLRGCDLIVQNPAVPMDLPLLKQARRRGIQVENEASLFLKLCPSKFILGVTGSKGKSTTAALLGAMMQSWNKRAVVAGNIRDAVMFDVLDGLTTSTPVVLELSSWHLELVGRHRLSLPLAVVTNVYQEHLNRYSSFRAYAQAKAQIFLHQQANQAVVLNYDNPVTRRLARQAPGKIYWFSCRRSVTRGAYLAGSKAYWRAGQTKRLLFTKQDVKIPGLHNLANALAAAAAAYLSGVPPVNIRAALRAFIGFHDRLEFIGKVRGVDFYNDTTATAPAATEAALEAFGRQPLVVIAGGADKNLDYRHLAKILRQRVDALVLLPGSATVKLQQGLRHFRHVLLAASMPEAVRLSAACARSGGAVLLSPGAASFGLFRHEFDRGAQFARAVRRLSS